MAKKPYKINIFKLIAEEIYSVTIKKSIIFK